jgi:hypothetical protein
MRLVQTKRLSDFSIGLAFPHQPRLLPAFHDAGSKETSIDTFVQLVSLHFSGLIAIVRSQEALVSVIAERELGAFIRAVTELFGPEQARFAAEYWIDELESMDALPGPTRRDWGAITVAASARLARRLNTDVDHPTAYVRSTDTKVSPIPSSNCIDPTGLA